MPSWIDLYNGSRSSAEKSNGTTPQGAPRVTNEQAASLLRMVMDQSTKYKIDAGATEHWYPIALALAGWRQPGDKFLVDDAHRKAMFPDGATAELWTLARNVAVILQTKGVAPSAPTVNPQLDYTAVLKQAWSKMQRDAKSTGTPSPPSPMPLPPAAAATPSESGGGNGPLLLLAALFLLGRKKGR